MGYTLFQATLDLARLLMDVTESSATGGTTTTLVDSLLTAPSNYFSDAPYGTLWLKLTTPASKIITGHTTTTLTFTPAQAGAVAAGNLYAAAPGYFPKSVLIQAINAALREIGQVEYQAQITPVADQQSYTTVDNAAFGKKITRVELANAASAPYDWTQHYRWEQKRVGSTPTLALVFDENTQPGNTYPMVVYYLDNHGELYLDSHEVHPAVHPDRLKWEAAVHALRWRVQRTKMDDPTTTALLNEAKTQAEIMRKHYPLNEIRSPRHSKW